ncbi:PAP/25A associated domain family [Histoplasma capsulatum H143]|uniref:polynucleotide adenylyltransferase n=1 Tax=Ajellomyces capsulatus (strain H143) TaxID=544712 RepID=C6HSU0_AJECH|nr:PAP/25A associated domain family [Histoplasma capsulatum H143]
MQYKRWTFRKETASRNTRKLEAASRFFFRDEEIRMEIEVHCELLRNAAVERGNNYNHGTVPVHGIEELIDSSLYAVHLWGSSSPYSLQGSQGEQLVRYHRCQIAGRIVPVGSEEFSGNWYLSVSSSHFSRRLGDWLALKPLPERDTPYSNTAESLIQGCNKLINLINQPPCSISTSIVLPSKPPFHTPFLPSGLPFTIKRQFYPISLILPSIFRIFLFVIHTARLLSRLGCPIDSTSSPSGCRTRPRSTLVVRLSRDLDVLNNLSSLSPTIFENSPYPFQRYPSHYDPLMKSRTHGNAVLSQITGDLSPIAPSTSSEMAWAIPADLSRHIPPRPPFASQHSSSLPSTPYQHPRGLQFVSRSPSPNRRSSSPRSTHSESTHLLPSLRRPYGGCKYETGMAHFRRRIPYSLGSELLPKELGPLKDQLDSADEKKLSGDMRELYDRLLPSEESESRRLKFVDKLENLLNKQWPGNNIRVHVFGSSGNKLCSSDSDVDICITTTYKELEKVCILADFLAKSGMERVVCVSHARVPIVKIWDPELRLACDMNVNNTLALENTRMIRTYVEIDERVRQLAMIVKYWTKRRILNDAALGGTLSSYTWICLIINFLQTRNPPILPSLQERRAKQPKKADDPGSSFDDDMEKLAGFGQENKSSLGELLFQFFRYYGHEVDYETKVMSTSAVSSMSILRRKNAIGKDRHLSHGLYLRRLLLFPREEVEGEAEEVAIIITTTIGDRILDADLPAVRTDRTTLDIQIHHSQQILHSKPNKPSRHSICCMTIFINKYKFCKLKNKSCACNFKTKRSSVAGHLPHYFDNHICNSRSSKMHPVQMKIQEPELGL